MRNRLILILSLSLWFSACKFPATETDDGNSIYLTEEAFKLRDGRTVTCISFKKGYGGGLSCDWSNARRGQE